MKNVFLNRYKKWGQDLEVDKIEVKKALRINLLRTNEEELAERLKKKGVKLEKISWLPSAYFYEWDKALSSTPEHLLGHFYIQDAASQISAIILNPKSGEEVLDMASAPGGKTTQLSELMKNKGVVVALDVKRERIKILKNNIERMGCENVVVYNKDAVYTDDLGLKFDKVLLDAPCSGNFCIDSDWFSKRKLDEFNQKAIIQKRLLKSGVAVLKKGGVIVYSTCSLEKEENEDVIDWALSNLNVELININMDVGDPGLTKTTSAARRLWPNKTSSQGFFAAKMVKK